MKIKCTLFIACTIVAFAAFSQTDSKNVFIPKGSIVLVGSGGLSNTTNSTNDVDGKSLFSFNLRPTVSYFVADNIAVGLGLGYSLSSDNTPDSLYTDDELNIVTSTYSVGPVARWYFAKTDHGTLYFKANAFYQGGTTETDIYDVNGEGVTTTENSGFDAAIGPGCLIFVGKKMRIDIGYGRFGYNTVTKTTGSVETTTNTFGLDWAGTLSFGILFKLK
jgi:outer membrane protein